MNDRCGMSDIRKNILMIQNTLTPFGGGNAVSAWTLEALKRDYNVTLLLWSPVDLKVINRHYGTELRPSDVNILVLPAMLRHLVRAIPGDPWNFQRYALIMRWCKIISRRYDVLMACCDETDFGARGIQYINYPYQEKNWTKEPKKDNSPNQFKYAWDCFRARLRPWRLTSGFSFQRMRDNLTLTNSQWTREVYRRVYGSDSRVIYPPVPGTFPDVPWSEKEDGFVCIGRISEEKRIETMIDILEVVRDHFPDIHLHIIGFQAKWDKDIYKRVKQRAAVKPPWIFLHENISREALTRLVSGHRYGIHGMKNEHFGIGVAEMVRGGCIPFVPGSGGQVEIVGNESRLLYQSREEAVRKILHVLNDPKTQAELREHLNRCRALFSTERFMRQIREVIETFSSSKG